MIYQPEMVEQPDLRRADWRFLLPRASGERFEHLAVLGGPAGLAGAMAAAGAARRVSDCIPASESVDALAVLHDSPVRLADAARSLSPDGVLYYEVKRPATGNVFATPNRVCREMRELGLRPSGVYWVTPDFTNYRQYVPVDAAGAVRWYLTTRYAPLSARQYLLGKMACFAAWRMGERVGACVPNFAVVATASGSSSVEPAILTHPVATKILGGSLARPLLLTNGADNGSRVIILPFTADAATPRAVLKATRLAVFNANIEREQQTLAEIRSHLDGSLRRSIPQPLGIYHDRDLAVGAESYASGRSLLISSWQWRRPMRDKVEDLRLVANWLGTFNRRFQHPAAAWSGWELRHEMDALIAAYIQAFGSTPQEDRLWANLRQYIDSLQGVCVPITRRHIDFVPTNVYRDNQALSVIDWEDRGFDFEGFGPALCDLLHFTAHWGAAVHGVHAPGLQHQTFSRLFLEPNGHAVDVNMARRLIAAYMRKCGVAPCLYPVLLVYTSVEHALERLNRQMVYASSSDLASRQNNRYVKHIECLAENVDLLFSAGLGRQILGADDGARRLVSA
ncbi:MAG: hypothetical protein H0V47_04050 [Chloroflexia bacterium]|nr:hypothetical protein [Chloroflexia bacterium]